MFTSQKLIGRGLTPVREGCQGVPEPVWMGGGGRTVTSGPDMC